MAFGKTSKGDILDVEKAVIILYGENNCQKKIPVLFNPSDYNISRNVNYAKLDIPGTDSPIMQFINGGETSLKLTLHFDTQNDYIHNKNSDDVRDYTEPIMSALWIKKAKKSGLVPPRSSGCLIFAPLFWRWWCCRRCFW